MYMPMVLMGMLALGSYWLMRATPQATEPAPVRVARHDPTEFMRNFAVRTYKPDGSLRSEVKGQEGRHFPDDNSLEVDEPRIRHLSEAGVRFMAQARMARVNGAHDHAVLTGDSVVVRESAGGGSRPSPPLEFRGQQLTIDSAIGELRSDEPVELTRGADRIRADKLVYRDDARVAEFSGRVRATFSGRSGR
jgi:lipopolysaccharide export system protein LptC